MRLRITCRTWSVFALTEGSLGAKCVRIFRLTKNGGLEIRHQFLHYRCHVDNFGYGSGGGIPGVLQEKPDNTGRAPGQSDDSVDVLTARNIRRHVGQREVGFAENRPRVDC